MPRRKWDPPRRRTKRSSWCSLSSPARPGLVGAEPPSRSVLSEGRCERSCRHVAQRPRPSCLPRGSRRPGRHTMCVEASLPIGSTPHPASRETTRVRMRTDSHRRNLAFRTFERSVGGGRAYGRRFRMPPFSSYKRPGSRETQVLCEPWTVRSTIDDGNGVRRRWRFLAWSLGGKGWRWTVERPIAKHRRNRIRNEMDTCFRKRSWNRGESCRSQKRKKRWEDETQPGNEANHDANARSTWMDEHRSV